GERAAGEKTGQDRGRRPPAEHLAYRTLLQVSSQRLDLVSERLDLPRLRLERRDRHAGVGVEVDHVAHGVDREARLHVVDEEAELRAGGVPPVPEGGEPEPHQLVVQALHILIGEIPDLLLVPAPRDRAEAPVSRVARRAEEESIAGVPRVAARSLGRARRARRLAAAARRHALVTMAPAHGVAAGVEPARRRTLRRRSRAAAHGAVGRDAQALVLALPVDAAIVGAAVPVVAVEVAPAPGRQRGGRRRRRAASRAAGVAAARLVTDAGAAAHGRGAQRRAADAAPPRPVGPRAAAGDGPRPAARGAHGAAYDSRSAVEPQPPGPDGRVGDADDAVDVARVARRRRAVALGRRGGARVGDGLCVAGTIATAREGRPRDGEREREGGEGRGAKRHGPGPRDYGGSFRRAGPSVNSAAHVDYARGGRRRSWNQSRYSSMRAACSRGARRRQVALSTLAGGAPQRTSMQSFGL